MGILELLVTLKPNGVGRVKVKKRFPDGLPLMDPVEDMGITDKAFAEKVHPRVVGFVLSKMYFVIIIFFEYLYRFREPFFLYIYCVLIFP